MVTIEFFDPSGALEVTQPFAPRIDTLAGKRIGIVTNEQWQAFRTLPLLRELIQKDFPTAEVLPIDAYPQGNVLIPTEETAQAVKASGVDAVIVGNAA
jgi:ABC-type amino acid transport substrate-binding protein